MTNRRRRTVVAPIARTAGLGRDREKAGIVTVLASAGSPLKASTIAQRTGGTVTRTARLLNDLRQFGRAAWVAKAAGWALPAPADASPRRGDGAWR